MVSVCAQRCSDLGLGWLLSFAATRIFQAMISGTADIFNTSTVHRGSHCRTATPYCGRVMFEIFAPVSTSSIGPGRTMVRGEAP